MLKPFRLGLLASCLAVGVAAQNTAPSGQWEGKIQVPDREVAITLHLDRNAQQSWIGHMNINPGPQGVPAAAISVEGENVKWSIATGGPSFDGTWDAGAATISGTFTQGSNTFPFSLKRVGDAKVVVPAASSPISKELEGKWEGTLQANQPLRLILELSSSADGKATGTLISVDQNNARLPVNSIVQKDNQIEFAVAAVGGKFSGTLNEAKNEMNGQWTQGPGNLPLTLTKDAAVERK